MAGHSTGPVARRVSFCDQGPMPATFRNALTCPFLRHSATSILKKIGVSPALVLEFIGHDSTEVSQNYARIEIEPMLGVTDLMPAVSAKGPVLSPISIPSDSITAEAFESDEPAPPHVSAFTGKGVETACERKDAHHIAHTERLSELLLRGRFDEVRNELEPAPLMLVVRIDGNTAVVEDDADSAG